MSNYKTRNELENQKYTLMGDSKLYPKLEPDEEYWIAPTKEIIRYNKKREEIVATHLPDERYQENYFTKQKPDKNTFGRREYHKPKENNTE